MATATIVTAWKDSTNAYVSAFVDEGGQTGRVEYGPVQTPLVDGQGNAKTNAQLKAELIAALSALRNKPLAANTVVLPITGTVTV